MRRETCEEKEQKHEERWRIPMDRYPLHSMLKGEMEKTFMRRNGHMGSLSIGV